MIIAIHGPAGSGKGAVTKFLKENYFPNFQVYSMGGIRRKMAADMGMEIAEFNKLGEKEGFTDKDVDEYQKKLFSNEDNFIIEGRLPYYFIGQSKLLSRAITVYLDVSEKEAAKRIFNDNSPNRSNESKAKTLDEQILLNRQRNTSDDFRYKKYYGIENRYDKNNYDLWIDTTNIPISKVVEKILVYINTLT